MDVDLKGAGRRLRIPRRRDGKDLALSRWDEFQGLDAVDFGTGRFPSRDEFDIDCDDYWNRMVSIREDYETESRQDCGGGVSGSNRFQYRFRDWIGLIVIPSMEDL